MLGSSRRTTFRSITEAHDVAVLDEMGQLPAERDAVEVDLTPPPMRRWMSTVTPPAD
jgi:hypothetical protein